MKTDQLDCSKFRRCLSVPGNFNSKQQGEERALPSFYCLCWAMSWVRYVVSAGVGRPIT